MKIIAVKTNTLTTRDFFYNGLSKDYIDALSFNVTYTKDFKIVVFNTNLPGVATINTINMNTYGQLQGYEIVLLEEVLKNLSNTPVKKDLYINLIPSNPGVLSDENIQNVTKSMHSYIEELKRVLSLYPNVVTNIHSTSRNLITILKEEITTSRIGFVLDTGDFNFIDVDYYVLISGAQNDLIIKELFAHHKQVIIYIASDYYISYLYNHYLGEKSTPESQEIFQKLAFMTGYPEIIYKVFET